MTVFRLKNIRDDSRSNLIVYLEEKKEVEEMSNFQQPTME